MSKITITIDDKDEKDEKDEKRNPLEDMNPLAGIKLEKIRDPFFDDEAKPQRSRPVEERLEGEPRRKASFAEESAEGEGPKKDLSKEKIPALLLGPAKPAGIRKKYPKWTMGGGMGKAMNMPSHMGMKRGR